MAQVLGAFLFLSVLFNFDYPAINWFSWKLVQPSIDCWLLLILLAIAAYPSKRLLFWITLTIYTLFMVLRLIHIGDTVVPMYFNRPLNLYIDSGYIFSLYDLLKTSILKEDVLLISASAMVIMLGYLASSWYAWHLAARSLLETPAIIRLYQEALSTRKQLKNQQVIVARMEKTAKDRKTGPASLKGLEGADVLLFMVESYGYIVFSRPLYREAMKTTMTNFAKVLERHRFIAVSSYLGSPTYGGISRFAHGTLEFGFRVENNFEYTALLRSSLRPLASYFRKSGYRTVSAMPGTRFLYPEGAYYDYVTYLLRNTFQL